MTSAADRVFTSLCVEKEDNDHESILLSHAGAGNEGAGSVRQTLPVFSTVTEHLKKKKKTLFASRSSYYRR